MLHALRAAGLSASLLPWNDSRTDPADFDLCVLRSCWDYHLAPDDFLAWIALASRRSRLLNPAAIVRWNVHKGYLRELEAGDVPIIPTVWIRSADRASLPELMASRGWNEVVVKPAIGAGSHMTRRLALAQADGAGQAFLDSLRRRGDALVQPFMPSVTTTGERALVWIDGGFTHQVVKRPRYHGEEEQVSAALQPTPDDLLIAERALGHAGDGLLYARVDLIDGTGGEPLVSELELVEPSLFLLQHRPALDRLVAAIARYA